MCMIAVCHPALAQRSFYLWRQNARSRSPRTGSGPLLQLSKTSLTFPWWKIWRTACDLKLSAFLAIKATIDLSRAAQKKSTARGRCSSYLSRDLADLRLQIRNHLGDEPVGQAKQMALTPFFQQSHRHKKSLCSCFSHHISLFDLLT